QVPLKKLVSSCHSPDWRSRQRRLTARRILAIATPEGVKRSSGSSTRLPIKVTLLDIWVSFRDGHRPRLCRRAVTTSRGSSVRRANDLVADDVVGERQHPVEIVDRIGVGLELDDRVETLVDVIDLIGEATLAPEIGTGDAGTPAAEE